MGRRIAAILAAFVAGFIVVSIFMVISMVLNPPPRGIDYQDTEAMTKYIATLPSSAFVIVIIGHSAGALIAAFTYIAIIQQQSRVGVIAFGIAFLITGLINAAQTPHPPWFVVIDSMLYIPAALLGGLVAEMLFRLNRGGSQSAPAL